MSESILQQPDISAQAATNPPQSSEEHASPPTRVIKPATGWQSLDLAELWHYRELFIIFALRDIKVRVT